MRSISELKELFIAFEPRQDGVNEFVIEAISESQLLTQVDELINKNEVDGSVENFCAKILLQTFKLLNARFNFIILCIKVISVILNLGIFPRSNSSDQSEPKEIFSNFLIC